jgi:hypothetical protein
MKMGNDFGIVRLSGVGIDLEKLVFPIGDERIGIAISDEWNFSKS